MLINSNFKKLVFEKIDKIPYGETRSYKEIAIAIGKPNSYRAVANACAKNPLPIIRPCHRVIRSDGKIGGYSVKGGTVLKRALLKCESF
jgi:O-6-methylguanine DNA methyltransferase|tara:strand:+ start:246 stop:512 length:267 start_codon:yes stop_codon:yes gene_type:complete